jgi:hypothetical protein
MGDPIANQIIQILTTVGYERKNHKKRVIQKWAFLEESELAKGPKREGKVEEEWGGGRSEFNKGKIRVGLFVAGMRELLQVG